MLISVFKNQIYHILLSKRDLAINVIHDQSRLLVNSENIRITKQLMYPIHPTAIQINGSPCII